MTEQEKLARYLYKLFEARSWEAIPHPETKKYWLDKARHIIAFLTKQAGYVRLADIPTIADFSKACPHEEHTWDCEKCSLKLLK